MRSINLFKQLSVGFLISLFASVSFYSSSLIFSYTDSLNLSIAVASLIYIAFILGNSHLKTGRVVVFTLISISAFTLHFFNASDQLVLINALLSIFVIRVIFYQSSWLPTAFDAGLIAIGFFIASGVLISTNSLFLSFWCFFFIQSFIVYQSDIFPSKESLRGELEQPSNKTFCHAKTSADQAIQQISNLTHTTH